MKKKYVVVAIAGVIIAAGISIAAYTTYNGGNLFTSIVSGGPRHDYTGGATINFHDIDGTSFNDVTGDYRPEYDNLTDVEYEWVFGNLPSFPSDFFDIVNLIYEGKYIKYEEISENYWKQPEFFVGWFNCYSRNYPNNDPDMWAVEGYSFFPLIKEISVGRGQTIESNCYFRSGYGVETYQGLVVKPYFPSSGKDMLGRDLFEQPDDVSNYISVSIINPDDKIYESFKNDITYDNVGDSDWFVVFKPTYTVVNDKYGEFIQYMGFYDDWVRLLTLQIDIDENTPSGEYVIGLEIEPPCFEINQEYYFSMDHEYFGMYYYPVSQLAKSNIPSYQLILVIE